MPDLSERAESRLENLEAIEPLLSSLRVLSLSAMQMALNRKSALQTYAARYTRVLTQLRQAAHASKPTGVDNSAFQKIVGNKTSILLVLGSARGICGQYNRKLSQETARLQADWGKNGREIWAFGARLQSRLKQEGIVFTAYNALAQGNLPSFALASSLFRALISRYEQGELNSVEVLSFRNEDNSSRYHPVLTGLLPEAALPPEDDLPQDTDWRQPIIEGDPHAMIASIGKHLLGIRFYELLLDAIAAENSYRYQLLEEAKDTTSNLVDELSLQLQINKRQRITQELQELIVGSGMLLER